MDEDLASLEERILKMPGLEQNVHVDAIGKHVQASTPEIMKAINSLLSKGKVELSQGPDKQAYCKLKATGLSYEGLEPEEALVYESIAKAGNQGVWTRDIRGKTGLISTSLNKVIKSLEGKKKIKSVKSVMAGKKKVYMLHDLIPDTKVTGDLFYSDQQEFDTEFTEVMFNTTLNILEAKAKEATNNDPLKQRTQSYATVREILDKILQSKLFKVPIAMPDMTKVLRSLTFSGRVECSTKPDRESGEDVDCYRVVTPLMKNLSLVSMPCGACPVMQQCSNTGSVTPTTCVYLTEWLNMDLPQPVNTATASNS